MLARVSHPSRRRRRRAGGVALIYVVLATVAIFAFCTLAVDYARRQVVRTQLRRAADAAAMYAMLAQGKGLPAATVQAYAVDAANDNTADGTPVAIDPTTNVDFLDWDAATRTYTTLAGSNRSKADAIRVTASRTISLYFGSFINQSTTTVTVESIAGGGTRAVIDGYIGLEGITVKNNLFSGGYYSSDNKNVSHATAADPGMIGSNATITGKNNTTWGQVILGPGGSFVTGQNLTQDADPIYLSVDLPTDPPDFGAAPSSNPNGVSKTLSVSGTVTLAAGTYAFTSITLGNNASLQFAGPATLYINGSVTFSQNGEVRAYGDLPTNLTIYQKGVGSTFGGSNANDVLLIASVDAPETDFFAKNNAELRGNGRFKTITAKNNLDLFYDESLAATLAGYSIPGGALKLVR